MSDTRIGTPVWVGLAVLDLVDAQDFYGRLLGWTFRAERGLGRDVAVALVDGRMVAGLSEPDFMGESTRGWTTYFATRDLEESCARAEAGGGRILTPIRDFRPAGRAALVEDPQRAAVGLFEAADRQGVERVSTPGALAWNELDVVVGTDPTPFYASVLGREAKLSPATGRSDYDVLTVGGDTVAGVHYLEDTWTEPMPAKWLTYFAVADVDGAVARLAELGGTVARGAATNAYGRTAIVRDRTGTPFGLTRLAAPIMRELP
jgi:predicted enzyme related to lactoylglutathione lyase